jgi:hypothetical protein
MHKVVIITIFFIDLLIKIIIQISYKTHCKQIKQYKNTNKNKIKKNKSKSQQVSSYKTKVKSNATYVEESDKSDNLEDLERELQGK